MSTVSDNDSGWTGTAHNNVDPDEGPLVFKLTDVSGSGPASCGTATIDGIDPASRMCRCADDNRQVCDQPGDADLTEQYGGRERQHDQRGRESRTDRQHCAAPHDIPESTVRPYAR